jgi:ribonuclease PH
MIRNGDRRADELRHWVIVSGVLRHAEGSALIEAGNTKVVCAATVEDRVPPFLKNSGKGWVTAEYSMLPRSTHTRTPRERGGRLGGRTQEIQRMIGRSLRCVVDLTGFGERTVTLDCDVLQADGGTRTASVTAAWVALQEAMNTMVSEGLVASDPVKDSVAAVSVGVLGNELLLDLDYDEDSAADVDMNVVVTGQGRLVEVQATAERAPFSLARMNSLVRLAKKGIREIARIQERAVNNQG